MSTSSKSWRQELKKSQSNIDKKYLLWWEISPASADFKIDHLKQWISLLNVQLFEVSKEEAFCLHSLHTVFMIGNQTDWKVCAIWKPILTLLPWVNTHTTQNFKIGRETFEFCPYKTICNVMFSDFCPFCINRYMDLS